MRKIVYIPNSFEEATQKLKTGLRDYFVFVMRSPALFLAYVANSSLVLARKTRMFIDVHPKLKTLIKKVFNFACAVFTGVIADLLTDFFGV